jgi:hypothetical protein
MADVFPAPPKPRVPEPDPARARREAVEVVRALRDAGHEALFAGGCVRDELLGQHPTDFDIATGATPDHIQRLFRRTHAVGAAFGVMLVRQNGVSIEVATFRAEGPYTDKRRPDSVRFAGAEEDARRRDFTINALFLDPLAPREGWTATVRGPRAPIEGKVIDLVGGVDDLHAGVIRAVGDPEARLSEDHLRALRAVRFAARFGFALDEQTALAIRRHTRELAGISRERIGEELKRMFSPASRAAAAEMLFRLGLDVAALRQEAGGAPVDAPPWPAFPRLAGIAGEPVFPAYPAALAAWALDRQALEHGGAQDKPGLPEEPARALAQQWRHALCLSNFDRDGLIAILAVHGALRRDWVDLAPAKKRRLAARPGFRPALAIVTTEAAEHAGRIRTDLLGMNVDPDLPPPEPLVTGDDLVGMGMRPSPMFKGLLDAIYDAQLESEFEGKPAALEFARRLAASPEYRGPVTRGRRRGGRR